MNHLYSALAAAALALALSCVSGALHAAELKIGFVDINRIMRESVPANLVAKRLEKEFAPRVQEMQRRESQLKSLQTQLEKESVTISETDRRAKEQELSRGTLELQRMQRSVNEDLNIRRNQELQGLFERGDKVIKQIADAEKFDLIIQEAVWFSPRLDITDRVLKALAAER